MKRLHILGYSFIFCTFLLGGCSTEQLMNMAVSNVEEHYGENGKPVAYVERLSKASLNLIKPSAKPVFGRVLYGVPTQAQFMENTFTDSSSSKIVRVYAEGRANVAAAMFDAYYKSLEHSNLFGDIVQKTGAYKNFKNSGNYDLVIWFSHAGNRKIEVDRDFSSTSFVWKILETKSGKSKTLPIDWRKASFTVLSDWVNDVHAAALELNASFSKNSSVSIEPEQTEPPVASGRARTKCTTADKLEFIKAGYKKVDIDEMCGG